VSRQFDDAHREPYRYEIQLEVILAGDGLDHALRLAREVGGAVQGMSGVVRVVGSMPRHRNDLDHALAEPDR
jgi:hypothetical protein